MLIIGLVVSHVACFIAGMLVYRNNKQKFTDIEESANDFKKRL